VLVNASHSFRIAAAALLVALGGAPASEAPAAPATPPDAAPIGEHEMAPRPARSPDSPEKKALRAAFLTDLLLKARQQRLVFDKYFPTLGTQGMLEAFEERNPFCHGEAHELGRAVFARVGDLGKSLVECGTGCTSACMHGVLKEAFGESTIGEIGPRLASVCGEGAMKEIQKPGNCAHGMGHALMMVTDNDVERAISGCGGFGDAAMGYYCVTGVFMEFFDQAPDWDRRNLPVSYPCDTFTAYPAACFRYQGPRWFGKFGSDLGRVAAACRALDEPLRGGCFHGLGFASVGAVVKDAARLAELCPEESGRDQTMFLEGVMESLGGFDREVAENACAQLSGEARRICLAAASEGMYRLAKPSLPLYLPQSPPSIPANP
jgi:hypothetical protein